MVYCIADNITSPLGDTSAANYQAIKSGRSALCRYENYWGIPHPFTASLFSEEQTQAMAQTGMTRFESLAIHSISNVVNQFPADLSSDNVVLILCTTKANIELLNTENSQASLCTPATAAQHIAMHLGIKTAPIVTCNACISGVSGLVLAHRLLETQQYDYAIVCGVDVQCRFTISGFQSLQALSADDCKPFDIERTGLNLGEAAATLVLSRTVPKDFSQTLWGIGEGTIRNDAFHISSPSKNAEGAYQALSAVAKSVKAEELAVINAHGTATMYNDQMESVAIERAELGDVPVNALKGYLGHTLGAAGVIESILTMKALDEGIILATRGYEEIGVSSKINVVSQQATTQKKCFIKMISGFGGCNGAALFCSNPQEKPQPVKEYKSNITHSVRITPNSVLIDGEVISCPKAGSELLTYLYKEYVNDYPKYYKMDALSKLGFVATELLLKAEERQGGEQGNRAIILFNHSSSIMADRQYVASIQDQDQYFPSPAAFVYTLPNMVTGEIAIRHQYHGETSFYILNQHDEQLMNQVVSASFADPATHSAITGWLDYQDDEHFEADIYISERI